MFKPSKEEIEKAMSGGREPLVFTHGEEVTFLVKEVKEKKKDDGSTLNVIVCDVKSGTNTGKEHAHFINENEAGNSILISMFSTFLTLEQIMAGVQVNQLVGRTLKSVAKVKAGKNGKIWPNFYDFTDGAPQVGGVVDPAVAATQASDIPF